MPVTNIAGFFKPLLDFVNGGSGVFVDKCHEVIPYRRSGGKALTGFLIIVVFCFSISISVI